MGLVKGLEEIKRGVGLRESWEKSVSPEDKRRTRGQRHGSSDQSSWLRDIYCVRGSSISWGPLGWSQLALKTRLVIEQRRMLSGRRFITSFINIIGREFGGKWRHLEKPGERKLSIESGIELFPRRFHFSYTLHLPTPQSFFLLKNRR